MSEENNTVNVETVETTKPKAPAAVKSFNPIGDETFVSIEQEGRPTKEVSFQFGHLVTSKEGEDDKIAGRFRVLVPVIVDGMTETVEGMSQKADKALDVALRNANLGAASDWTFTLEGEFFDQKYVAPRIDENDFWNNKAFDEIREDIMSLRDDAEAKAEAVEAAKDDAQSEAIEFSTLLKSMLNMVGGNLKVLESVLRGPDSEATNHPRLRRLGKGANAVREALRFAELTPAMISVVPNSVTSGKALDYHKGKAVSKLCEEVVSTAEVEWPAGFATKSGQRLPNLTSLGKLLRQLMRRSFGVSSAETEELTLTEAAEEAIDNAATKIADFLLTHGKSVNTYAKEEYNASLVAYGLVLSTDEAGTAYLTKAVRTMLELSERLSAPDVEADAEVVGLRGLFNNNLLVKRLIETAWAHKSTVLKENKNRELMKTVDEDEGPISKTARMKFAMLDTDAAAVHLVKMIQSHPKAATLFAKVKSIGGQVGFEDKVEETQEAAE